MLPVVLIWRAPWPNRSQIIHIAIAGALLQAGYVGGVWAAVKEGMSAGLTALIVGLQPILTAWFAAWIAEKVTPKQWLGLVLGLLGVGLVVWAKLSLTGMSHLSLVFIVIAASALICLPLMFLFETREIIWATELILSLIWAVLALSIGAISLLFVMIRNGEATRVTSLMYLTPPTTAIMAWLLFNEPITWTIILGIAITMSAVILVNRTTSK
jgi:drug/metabolite transporter (DMT)-like permease